MYEQRRIGENIPQNFTRSRVDVSVRCARNCFLCPNCRNTLSVVPSDPPDSGESRASSVPASVVGEAPFVLYCNYCRWDSLEVDIKFDKPTGLAGIIT